MIPIIFAFVALVFSVLVYYLIQTLKSLTASLNQTNQVIGQVQHELATIGAEVQGLVKTATLISEDIHSKMKSLNPLFHTVDNVGHVLDDVTTSLKNASANVFSPETSLSLNSKPSQQGETWKLLQWAGIFADVWNSYKKRQLIRHTDKQF